MVSFSIFIFRICLVGGVFLKSLFYFFFLLILARILISSFMAVLGKTWVSILFFLIYVGALMILFFYFVRINSNPSSLNWNILVVLVGGMIFMLTGYFILFEGLTTGGYNQFLFINNNMFILVILFVLLLVLLWVLKKIKILVFSSFRTFF